MASPMLGEILDGKYRIDKQLGAGGMGNVYLATHLGTTRIVAVKVIAPRWAAEPHFLARFQREAQACGRLRHPNIVNVTDFGIAKSAAGDMPYLVMEFLDGQTLSDFQKETPVIPLPQVADLLDQIGLALAEAHCHGIVHRDLKPDNIWLESTGRGTYNVKVLDFGVAKVNLLGEWAPEPPPLATARPPDLHGALSGTETLAIPARARAEEIETIAIASTPGSFDNGASAQTMPGSLLGTPAYMSPEQALGREVDYRSDIYSLAVVAYSLVCGALPFTGTAAGLLEYHQSGHPIAPADLNRIPRDVSDAILAGLALDPEDRPASAVAFTRRFHNAVDAEFLALRRSKAFLLQHLTPFAFLLLPIYTCVLTVAGILVGFSRKIVPAASLRVIVIPVVAAALFVFSDNTLRAAAALMALDERARIRRFLSFRVLWKLMKMTPALVKTQFQSMIAFGPGWIVGDCLWPVVCAVEKRAGKDAVLRSRELMTGLRSAGRALAIRHLALAALSIADILKSLGFLWKDVPLEHANVVITAAWFPVFAVVAAAPLFLYDRTAAGESGPLLQLDRTPEIRTTTRLFSTSSLLWLIAGGLYLLYQPLALWFSRSR